MRSGPRSLLALTVAALLAAVSACSPGADDTPAPTTSSAARTSAAAPVSSSPTSEGTEATEAKGIEKLDHLVFIVMENRSFDHFFGTFPGANGFPKRVCVPDPEFGGKCQSEYHDTDTYDVGGPHTQPAAVIDTNGGKMNGFLEAATEQPDNKCGKDRASAACKDRVGPAGQLEVMGYHNQQEIPLYWQLAKWGVLQDKMFAPSDSWTLPAHLFLMSAWSAVCSNHNDPMSCRSSIGAPNEPDLEIPKGNGDTPYAWTDITYLLNKADVSWGYFVSPHGTCYAKACDVPKNENKTTGYQNPMPGFLTVKEDKTEKNIQPYTNYVRAAKDGSLPSVSWVMPAINESDHPGHGNLIDGQRFVADMVNAASQGPEWESTAIFVVWDDWGGFYDHVKPLKVDGAGYGIRVPAFMVSPYAKQGYIDSQTLSFDAYLKFIEDRFLDGDRLDPKKDGRPDPRPTVREEVKQLGDLTKEFDFSQEPRQLPVLHPPKK